MSAKKKPRKKAYRPKGIAAVPPILLCQEPDAKFVEQLTAQLRTSFISLLMGTGGEKAFRVVLRHLMLGILLVERFENSQGLREHLQMAAERTVDALQRFLADGTYDMEAVSAVERESSVVTEIVSKAPAGDVGLVMTYLARNAEKLIDKLIDARQKDIDELRADGCGESAAEPS